MKKLKCATWALAAAGALFCSASAAGQHTCFTAEDSRGLPFEVIVQAPPPKSESEVSWKYHPASGAASADLRALNRSESPSLKKYWFLWANRCHAQMGSGSEGCGWNKKGNVLSPRFLSPEGKEIRTFFSTFDAADNCSLIQAGWALGQHYSDIAELAAAAKITVLSRSADLLPLVKEHKLTDICLLPEERLGPAVVGVVLDYEVQDRRSPQHSERFLLAFAKLVQGKGKRALLFANPLDAPTQRYTGLNSENMQRIAPAFDAVGVMLWGGNKQKSVEASAAAQMQMLKHIPSSHIFIVFELSRTSMLDARFVHDAILCNKYAGVMLWRNYAEVGGSCESDANLKIACAIFGRC